MTLASGLVSQGFDCLARSGALKAGADHRAGVAHSDAEFCAFLQDQYDIHFATVEQTHDASLLAEVQRFTAINSAPDIDLFGQTNLEWQKASLFSGVGGAPDFARAAMNSSGRRSIIALPSTARGGETCWIVFGIDAATISLRHHKVDTVVTEHGIAQRRDRSMEERAEALIAIADPQHQKMLGKHWSVARGRS